MSIYFDRCNNKNQIITLDYFFYIDPNKIPEEQTTAITNGLISTIVIMCFLTAMLACCYIISYKRRQREGYYPYREDPLGIVRENVNPYLEEGLKDKNEEGEDENSDNGDDQEVNERENLGFFDDGGKHEDMIFR